jgi:hypothetical protein
MRIIGLSDGPDAYGERMLILEIQFTNDSETILGMFSALDFETGPSIGGKRSDSEKVQFLG